MSVAQAASISANWFQIPFRRIIVIVQKNWITNFWSSLSIYVAGLVYALEEFLGALGDEFHATCQEGAGEFSSLFC